jgi:hypothetical protein
MRVFFNLFEVNSWFFPIPKKILTTVPVPKFVLPCKPVGAMAHRRCPKPASDEVHNLDANRHLHRRGLAVGEQVTRQLAHRDHGIQYRRWSLGKEGRWGFVEEQNNAILWGFFFFLIFNFNKGILVILHPKTTSFWVFHPF